MRILFVCNEYPPTSHGGIGVFVKELAQGLTQKGHKVAVIGYDPDVKNDQIQNENKVSVTRLKIEEYRKFRIGRFTLSMEPILTRKHLSNEIQKLILNFKPELIESFDWSGPLWKKPSVKLIVRMHGANTAHQIYENKQPSKLLAYFEKKNISFADSLCAVSHHIGIITLNALGHSSKNYKCIYNFVNTDEFRPDYNTPVDPFKLIYFGRINPRKGMSEIFQIIKVLFQYNSSVYLELAGPYQCDYKEKLLNILYPEQRSRVVFLGNIAHTELPFFINSGRLFIMPSRAEAFGLTVIEAMACGVPVIITDRASGPEIIDEGVNGWLFDICNPLSSAHKINKLLSQQELLDEIGRKGRKYVIERFSKKIIIEENIAFYESILS